MDKSTDLRVIKTNKALKDALIELMDTIGFDKITVQGLTKKAMVSRTTFYLHYLDKYDLLEKIENEILLDMQNIVSPFIEQSKSIESLTLLFNNIAVRIYSYIKDNEKFFKLILSEKGDPSFISKFYDTVQKIILQNFDLKHFKIPPHYAISIIVSIQTGLIKEWLNSDMQETPEELASLMAGILSYIPNKILGLGLELQVICPI